MEIQGRKIRIQRMGTDGDLKRAMELVQELDGQVDAFGLGGIDLYIYAGKRRYTFRDAKRIAQGAKQSPVVDGSGLKNSLERRVIRYLADHGLIDFSDKKVLLVSAVDRFGMAETLAEVADQVVYGDLVFALGLPVPLRSLRTLHYVAWAVAPIVTQLPFRWLYPTGEKQETSSGKTKPIFADLYRGADIIAGDFHFIRRYMPGDLEGKTVITNTVTADDVAELRSRGVEMLVTTTPSINGRSMGTNLLEAIAVAMTGREMAAEDYLAWLEAIEFRPHVEKLQEGPVEGIGNE
ncbi:MAG: quinate 5-dehydrogenase [Limnochordia bacterium]